MARFTGECAAFQFGGDRIDCSDRAAGERVTTGTSGLDRHFRDAPPQPDSTSPHGIGRYDSIGCFESILFDIAVNFPKLAFGPDGTVC